MLNNSEAYQQALDLFTESVIKPDYELRANASYAGCYFELMEIRQHCLAYLKTLKEIHQIETGDESDAIEAEKSLMTKTASRKIAFLMESSCSPGFKRTILWHSQSQPGHAP